MRIKNRAPALQTSTYEALFGSSQEIGLTDSHTPSDGKENQMNMQNDKPLTKVDKLQNSKVGEVTELIKESRKIDDGKIQELVIKTIDLGKAGSLKLCAARDNDTSGAHKCSDCHEYIHVVCGGSDENDGFGANVICKLSLRKNSIPGKREYVKVGLKKPLSHRSFDCA